MTRTPTRIRALATPHPRQTDRATGPVLAAVAPSGTTAAVLTIVTDELDPGETKFTVRVGWVQADFGDDAHEAGHLMSAEERLRVTTTIKSPASWSW